MFPLASLVGQSVDHLAEPTDDTPVHRAVVPAFVALREAARDAGFDLRILSGFRSFDRQLSIWNRKVRGELPVLDSAARPLDVGALSEHDLVLAILRWSALPGASRHHWGTDLDIYDETARPPRYTVDLIPAEVERGGMFAPLHEWLDARIANGTSFGFFRPYEHDLGGVAPERWHVSHGPVAASCLRGLTPAVLRQAIEPADMLLKDVVLRHLEEIYARFVTNTNPVLP